jgi:hypothetical protein
VEGDGRSPWARCWRDLVELHAGDLGGMYLLSEAQLSLIKRAATIEVELEQVEGRLSTGRDADLDLYTRSTSHLRRIFETLGIERRPRDVTPTLGQYLTARATAASNSEPAGESNVAGPSRASADDGNRTSEAGSVNQDGTE